MVIAFFQKRPSAAQGSSKHSPLPYVAQITASDTHPRTSVQDLSSVLRRTKASIKALNLNCSCY